MQFDQLTIDVADSFGDAGNVRLVVIGFVVEFIERLRRSGMSDEEIRQRLMAKRDYRAVSVTEQP